MRPSGEAVQPRGFTVFQSLLYWISHCGPASGSSGSIRCICFNPCCIGLAIAASLASQARYPGWCFNPCCIGLAIAARGSAAGQSGVVLFQSLLYWISHCGLEFLGAAIGIKLFQSLLYWISHCGWHDRLYLLRQRLVSILVVLD